jgi:adenine/guanine phosphoribosyltransferase-like PRPP-binding protein
MPRRTIISSHLNRYLNPVELQKHVNRAVRALKKHDFDTIAFRGMSGALLAPPIALALKKELILVRKDSDDSHTFHTVEGNCNAKRYVIVDDFVYSGKTKRAIIDAVSGFALQAEFIGMVQVNCLGVKHLDADRTPNYPFS